MLRVFVDQDFDHDILRGLRLHLPDLDAITALQAGLDRKPDPEILAWAAGQNRIVVTHDRNTMPAHAYDRVRKGERMAGVFVVPRQMPVGKAISELELLIACSLEGEWFSWSFFCRCKLRCRSSLDRVCPTTSTPATLSKIVEIPQGVFKNWATKCGHPGSWDRLSIRGHHKVASTWAR